MKNYREAWLPERLGLIVNLIYREEHRPIKTILILTLLQLAVLATLVHRIILVEDQLGEITSQTLQSPAKVLTQPVEKSTSAVPEGFGLNEDRLRRIVRSEIRSELNQFADSLLETPSGSLEKEAGIDPVENTRRLELVKQELSFFIERGEISDPEMQEFQMEISRLDPDSSTMMIRELVRALNSGELRGRL